jgi:hypothetical protein
MNLEDNNLSFSALIDAINIVRDKLKGEETLSPTVPKSDSALSRLCQQFRLSPLVYVGWVDVRKTSNFTNCLVSF